MKLAVSLAVGFSTILTLMVLSRLIAIRVFGMGEDADIFTLLVSVPSVMLGAFMAQAFYEMFE